jgi:DnaJ-like protein
MEHRHYDIDIARTEYDKLGITESYASEDIEGLRRLLAKRFHPDNGREPNAARMKDVNNACDILGNPKERERYDSALKHARSVTHEQTQRGEGERESERRAEAATRQEQKTQPQDTDATANVTNALRGQARADAIRRVLAREWERNSSIPPRPTATSGSGDGSTMHPRMRASASSTTSSAGHQPTRRSVAGAGWVVGIVGILALIVIISVASHGGGTPAPAPARPQEPTGYTCHGNELETAAGGATGVAPAHVDELRGTGGDGDVNAGDGVHVLTPGSIGQTETILIRVGPDFSPRWCRLLGPFSTYWETVTSLHIDASHIVMNDYPDNGACEVRLVINLRTGYLASSHIIQNETDCEHEALTTVLGRDAVHAEGPRP